MTEVWITPQGEFVLAKRLPGGGFVLLEDQFGLEIVMDHYPRLLSARGCTRLSIL